MNKTLMGISLINNGLHKRRRLMFSKHFFVAALIRNLNFK